MKSKRFFKSEIKFLLILILIIILPIIIVGGSKLRKRDFKYYLLNKDYDKLYTFIRYPSFTKKVFEKYMSYNFSGDLEILEDKRANGYRFITVKTDKGEKIISLSLEDGKEYWFFNDYANDFSIEAPLNAKVFIEDMVYINTTGRLKVEKLPLALYDVEAVLENCIPFRKKILAGQNFKIEMKLKEEAIKTCLKSIEDYYNFYQNSINTLKIQDISVLDKNSGLYKEVLDEIAWNKDLGNKVKKKILSYELKEAILENQNIKLKIKEKWEIKIDDGKKQSQKSEEYEKYYIFLYSKPNLISQIITNK